MDLEFLTDESLDRDTIALARTEREVLTQVLHHLQEIDRRRLYSKFELPSLFNYATERMGYSEDQAHRRISAMRLLRELPMIEEKIENGSLTLTHLARAQIVFRQEKKLTGTVRSSEDKLTLLEKIEGTSKREAEAVLTHESVVERPFDFAAYNAITIYQFNEPVRAKLARLVELKSENASNVEPLVGELADLGLERWDPLKKAERARTRTLKRDEDMTDGAEREFVPHSNDVSELVAKARSLKARSDAADPHRDSATEGNAVPSHEVMISRYIPAAVRHEIQLRDEGICRFCGTGRNLEIDHITPIALGGTNDLDNLRLVCRSCNQRAAIERFGAGKMEPYLDS